MKDRQFALYQFISHDGKEIIINAAISLDDARQHATLISQIYSYREDIEIQSYEPYIYGLHEGYKLMEFVPVEKEDIRMCKTADAWLVEHININIDGKKYIVNPKRDLL